MSRYIKSASIYQDLETGEEMKVYEDDPKGSGTHYDVNLIKEHQYDFGKFGKGTFLQYSVRELESRID